MSDVAFATYQCNQSNHFFSWLFFFSARSKWFLSAQSYFLEFQESIFNLLTIKLPTSLFLRPPGWEVQTFDEVNQSGTLKRWWMGLENRRCSIRSQSLSLFKFHSAWSIFISLVDADRLFCMHWELSWVREMERQISYCLVSRDLSSRQEMAMYLGIQGEPYLSRGTDGALANLDGMTHSSRVSLGIISQGTGHLSRSSGQEWRSWSTRFPRLSQTSWSTEIQ